MTSPLLHALLALAAASSSGERSPVIFPQQSIAVRFDHAQHLSGGADCLTCHDKARKSTRASDWNLPGHPECEQCHDLKKDKCSTCHPGFDQTARAAPPRIAFPTANLVFDHQVHVKNKVPCQRCHEDVSKVQLATVQQLPKMATCLSCHDGATAPSTCTTCHLKEPSGRLQLTFAQGPLRPMAGNPFGVDHGPRFEFTHAAPGSTARSTCLACHADRDCQKCHDGMQKPLSVHPNDWISLHALQVRGQVLQCESCHRLQSFCIACHERSGVSNEGLLLPAQNLKVHGDLTRWTGLVSQNRVQMTGNHHAFQAARDIRPCMSCHREETCLKCHSQVDHPSLQGRPANPHPPNFAAACRRFASINDRGCVLCHDEGYLAAQGCR
ncbi:MAG TPA: cytochrome c3 family protein [Myxococcaceae bacterium]|nr:cytochrome c3 family protein [Myxococcaceae bacterium]